MTDTSSSILLTISRDEVPIAEVRTFTVGSLSIAISHLSDKEWGAVENLCSHDNGGLGDGKIRRGNIVCPRHGASFDCITGRVKSLPAVKSIESFQISEDDTGQVHISRNSGGLDDN
ncbi:MAG: ferredoxin [Chloroflexi bacterium]|nr:ferredoxin [Chloroflexota bacterium]|tara:strand:- start:2296 stop:2646 length:351 start_codon:yes stop_codon:yes gene_type:complete